MMSEVLRNVALMEIPGLGGRYSASDDGRIWSHISSRFIKSFVRKDGYRYVVLRNSGRSVNYAVHRLVCAAWNENLGNKEQVNHKNLIKTDNTPSNLEWSTPKENTSHAWENLPKEKIIWMRKRRSAGALKANRSKRTLNNDQVVIVRDLVASGLSRSSVAVRFDVSRYTIDSIINGETYRD